MKPVYESVDVLAAEARASSRRGGRRPRRSTSAPVAANSRLQAQALADDLGVEGAGQAAVAGDEQRSRPARACSRSCEQRRSRDLGRRRPRRPAGSSCGSPARRAACASIRCSARRRRAAATISIARVILWMFLTERDPVLDFLLGGHGRPRRSPASSASSAASAGGRLRSSSDWMRSDSPSSSGLPSASKSGPKSSITSAIALPSASSSSSESCPSSSIRPIRSAFSACRRSSRSARNSPDALDLDPVEVAAGAGVDRGDLLGDRERAALVLVQRLDQALAAGELLLGLGVELGAELGEGLELAVLREVEAQLAGDLLHRLRLRVAADPRDRDADVDRRPDARVEEVGLEEDLAVGDRDHVGRDVGGDVVGLRLDDRQRGQRAAAEVVVEACTARSSSRECR